MKTIVRVLSMMSLVGLAVPAVAEEAAAPAAPAETAAPAPVEAKSETAIPVAPEGEAALEEKTAVEEPAAAASPAPSAAPLPAAAQVVEGAPLGNDNVYVHIVQRKSYTNKGNHELVLYPAVAQINSKFTRHIGAAGTYTYHVLENLALQVMPFYNYLNEESAFNQELINKGNQQAQAATALLLQYGAVGGIEVTPMYGKFAFYEGFLGQFSFVLNAGVGAGATRIQLRTDQTTNCGPNGCREAAFGDTGFKFLGQVGAGLRVILGERAAVRLEVRDFIYTARVNKINGCTHAELQSGRSDGGACDLGSFEGDDRQLAEILLRETSSDVLNNLSVFTGFSFLF